MRCGLVVQAFCGARMRATASSCESFDPSALIQSAAARAGSSRISVRLSYSAARKAAVTLGLSVTNRLVAQTRLKVWGPPITS